MVSSVIRCLARIIRITVKITSIIPVHWTNVLTFPAIWVSCRVITSQGSIQHHHSLAHCYLYNHLILKHLICTIFLCIRCPFFRSLSLSRCHNIVVYFYLSLFLCFNSFRYYLITMQQGTMTLTSVQRWVDSTVVEATNPNSLHFRLTVHRRIVSIMVVSPHARYPAFSLPCNF